MGAMIFLETLLIVCIHQGLFAASHWDYRKGAERQEVNWTDEVLDDPASEQSQAIFDAADRLGLVQSSVPNNKNPNYLTILGGANHAPLHRLAYGIGAVETVGKAIVYLGASRVLPDGERQKTSDYAPGAINEFELGCAALETVLGARIVEDIREIRDGDVWHTRMYEYEQAGVTAVAFALSTPKTIGKRRANTRDNYDFFARQAQLDIHPEDSVVSVTTGFYRQGQHLPGLQHISLPYGIELETIGHDAAYGGAVRKPTQLLQETKTAIDAAIKLDAALKWLQQLFFMF